MFIVASPDGSSRQFTDLAEAEANRPPGAQLRTSTQYRDVPATYAVVTDDGAVLSTHNLPGDASRASGAQPGTHVEIRPA